MYGFLKLSLEKLINLWIFLLFEQTIFIYNDFSYQLIAYRSEIGEKWMGI